MAPRPLAALAAGAVACAVLAACSEAGTPVAGAPVTRADYLTAVETLMEPPGQLASAISERTEPGSDGPADARLDALLQNAEDRLADFRAMGIADARVRAQRDGIARAYADLIPAMRTAVTSLEATPGAPVAADVDPFLVSLGGLPSAAGSSSSR